jgi:hypothetical protein
MSCFICNNETITVIAKAFVDYGVPFHGLPPKSDIDIILVDINKEVKSIGQALLEQNYASVNARYNEDTKTPEFTPSYIEYNEGTVMGCIECYEYQACETDDWDDCWVRRNLSHLKDAIIRRMCRKLGYEVPYGYGGHNILEAY